MPSVSSIGVAIQTTQLQLLQFQKTKTTEYCFTVPISYIYRLVRHYVNGSTSRRLARGDVSISAAKRTISIVYISPRNGHFPRRHEHFSSDVLPPRWTRRIFLHSMPRRRVLYTKLLWRTHTHTHTHQFNGPLSGTTRVSRYQRGKTKTVSGSDISWDIRKSAPRSRQITTPAPQHSVFYRPDALPAAQPTPSKH